jgi:hypothetical protein
MNSTLRAIAILAALGIFATSSSILAGQSPSEPKIREASPAPDATAVASLPSPADADRIGSEIFAKLVQLNDARTLRLENYTGTRQYELRNDKDQLSAQTVVRVEFQAPDTKTFETVSEEGSKWIRMFVFKRLIDSESEAAAGREHRDSSITPHNYAFRYLGKEDLDGKPCYVVYASPRRMDKYLFEGQVWIDAREFAIVKIAGHPAKNPSFWIKRVEWVRRYENVGGFWLPARDETLTDVRIFGKKKLIIDYQNYAVNQAAGAPEGSHKAGRGVPGGAE